MIAVMPSERIQRQIDRLLDEAESALSEGKWDVARVRAEAVLRLDPASGDARSYLEAATKTSPTVRPEKVASPAPQTPAAPPAPSQPESFANGRYTVKKFLGEGGKKKVYLAHDETLDRDVAFALIKTEGLDDTARQRVTREAQAMGRLGDHPNIVPIFDLGQEKDPATGVQQPFMVLPLMIGGDVEGVIEKATEHRLPLERALQIARDTCEGLIFAHSKGIVHRDLKPGNVMVTDRGTARIADFGLAVATDRSRLTREGFMVGTVSYMPPEQAMGGDITPRADLYSLGAMLYEMVTGRPPFLGDDDIAIIGQHINTPPVAPAWHRADCPRPLDSLIMRLLAKDPAQRPESASDVLSALQAVDLQTLPSPRSQRGEGVGTTGEGKEGRSLDSMSSCVFVGRHKEMDQLRASLEDALSGKGRMVALVGEPGIGKTRTSPGVGDVRRPPALPDALGPLLRGWRRATVLAVGAGDQAVRAGTGTRPDSQEDGLYGLGHSGCRIRGPGSRARTTTTSPTRERGVVAFQTVRFDLDVPEERVKNSADPARAR